nr:ankyrin repeat domain-containing protein [Azospirillum sp. 412522]
MTDIWRRLLSDRLPPLRPIFFVHIPKTAGTSAAASIGECFSDSAQIHHIEGLLAGDRSNIPNLSDYRFVSGHLSYRDAVAVCPPSEFLYISIIRNPIEQFLSHVSYILEHPQDTLSPFMLGIQNRLRVQGPGDFILNAKDDEMEFFFNPQSKALYGNDDVVDVPVDDIVDFAFRHYSLIGTTENVSDFLFLASLALRLPPLNRSVAINKTRKRLTVTSLSGQARQKLEQIVAVDLAVYRRVQSRVSEEAERQKQRFGIAGGTGERDGSGYAGDGVDPVSSVLLTHFLTQMAAESDRTRPSEGSPGTQDAPLPPVVQDRTSDVPLESLLQGGWNAEAGYLWTDRDKLSALVFAENFFLTIPPSAVPTVPNDHSLFLELIVSWHDTSIISGRHFRLASAPADLPFSHWYEVDKAAYLGARLCRVLIPVYPSLVGFGGMTLSLFNGAIHQPLRATLHALRFKTIASSLVPDLERTSDCAAVSELPGSSGTMAFFRSVGWSPLHFATNWNMAQTVEAMLAAGYDVNTAEHNGATALHRAADFNHIALLRRLLDHGADPNREDSTMKETPLDVALRKGHTELAELLTEHGGLTYAQRHATEGPAPASGTSD